MIRRAALGVWEFVVGDDWRAAAGTALALAGTALLAAAGLPAWWLAPAATMTILYRSVRRGVA